MQKIIILLLVIFFTPYYAVGQSSIDNELIIKERINNNIYKSKLNNKIYLSVGKGGYSNQIYTRDSFISFKGLRNYPEYKNIISNTLDIFEKLQLKNGYLPIWFRETFVENKKIDLNVYYYAPYNLDSSNGGIYQIDHLLDYINTINIEFEISDDKVKLRNRYIHALKVWSYLRSNANNYLIVTKYSKYAGPDWEDLILKSGKVAYINLLWYRATNQMAYFDRLLGNNPAYFLDYSEHIGQEIKSIFIRSGKPLNCNVSFDNYLISWINEDGKEFNYFNLDTNALAIYYDILSEQKSNQLIDEIINNSKDFYNKNGAFKNICGNYESSATNVGVGEYQNGGYWYIPGYYYVDALFKYKKFDILLNHFNDLNNEVTNEHGDLNEWYESNGKKRGGNNYSWSLSYYLYLYNLLKNAKL